MALAKANAAVNAVAVHPPRGKARLIAIAVLVLWFAFFGLAGPYVAWGLAMLPLPGLRVPCNVLFFLPQLMLPFFGAVRTSASGSTLAFSAAAQYALSAGLWGSVLIGFMFFAWRCRVRRLLWLAPVVILAVTSIANVALGVAGAGVQLEGP
jgi:hypothetical protein